MRAFLGVLVTSGVANALHCVKALPKYDKAPKYAGSVGPFGVVCEVKDGVEFPEPPSVPSSLDGKAFVVRSSFPGRFMETSTVPVRQQRLVAPLPKRVVQRWKDPNARPPEDRTLEWEQQFVANVTSSIGCGEGRSVGAVGDKMDAKVNGISEDQWIDGCIKCGQTLEQQGSLKPGWFCQIGRVLGVKSGIWLKRLADAAASQVEVDLTPGHEIIGFGGAFTDAVSVANAPLSKELQSKWTRGYFGASGAGFTVGRVHMGGCDFSRRAYSLVPTAGDVNLTTMCLMDDRDGAKCGQDAKVPIIKDAQAAEPGLKLFLSPWSAPAWMKTSNKIVGGAVRGIGSSKTWSDEDKLVAEAWAKHYVKYVDLMAAEGIKMWGMTLQNEPGADQFVSWNSDALKGADEYDLLQRVGPKMKAKYPDMKIMVHDDQVYALKERLLNDGVDVIASDLVDGVAYHWYGSTSATLENGTAQHATPLPLGPAAFNGGIQVKEVFDKHIKGKGKFMLATEACNGFLVAALHVLKDAWSDSNNRGVRPGDWYRGYRYSRDIFYQLSNGASGWTDWNLMLTWDGGPNWAGNNVDAPMLTSPDSKALWVSPMYFHLAHWAKYVIPGSKVLAVDRTSSELYEVAAFLRPDHRVVVVALNDELDGHGDPPANQVLRVTVGGMVVELDMISASIVTAVFDVQPGRAKAGASEMIV